MTKERGLDRYWRQKAELDARFDKLAVTIICGDPVLEIDGMRICKFDGASPEGRKVSEWWNRQWRESGADDAGAE